MDLNSILIRATEFVWGGPLIVYVLGISIIVTIYLGFFQFRYFFTAWSYIFAPEKTSGHAIMSPFQAFLGALSVSVGNGSLAGMATAIYSGGPGAALWVFILGLLSMSLRFAEVYLSVSFPSTSILGGPMVYLGKIPGRTFLPAVYAFFCMMLGFVAGNGMQSNSIRLGIQRITGFSPLIIAMCLTALVIYILAGGSQRVVSFSDAIIPVKVGLFFITMIGALAYHYQSLIPALKLIVSAGFGYQAFAAGLLGYSVQSAIRFGFSRSLNATESGLGTTGILFGATQSEEPVKAGMLGMLSTFISANLVCFSIMVLIVASGVWDSGLTSTLLTSAAFETVYGAFIGSWVVAFLTITFGLGVLVPYIFITRSCWLFLTGQRYAMIFNLIFMFMTFFGAQSSVALIWNSVDLINAGLLAINLYGIMWLLPLIKKGVRDYAAHS